MNFVVRLLDTVVSIQQTSSFSLNLITLLRSTGWKQLDFLSPYQFSFTSFFDLMMLSRSRKRDEENEVGGHFLFFFFFFNYLTARHDEEAMVLTEELKDDAHHKLQLQTVSLYQIYTQLGFFLETKRSPPVVHMKNCK